MQWSNVFLLLFFLASSYGEEVISTKRFPGKDKFLIGVATSAYQVEGAWNADGKGENIWDHLSHNDPTAIFNNDTGDIACDSYHKIEEDIAMLKELGVDHYRFSISWSRLLPTGYTNKINKKGIDYYNRLINALLENNIIPMVTLFHWDTPQSLEDEGGFENEFIVNAFCFTFNITMGFYQRMTRKYGGDTTTLLKTWSNLNNKLAKMNNRNIFLLKCRSYGITPRHISDQTINVHEGRIGQMIQNFNKRFGDYARLCFKVFGDRVKHWLTFNEPKQTCSHGYGSGLLAPRKMSNGIGEYICTHNVIKSHARAWHIYNDEFRREQNGEVGIALDSSSYKPANSSNPVDIQAAEDYAHFILGFYGGPIVYGDYPAVMKEKIDARSKAQGYASSRLPKFTEDEKKYIKGTIDYLGINCYTSYLTRPVTQPDPEGMGLDADSETERFQPDDWEKTPSSWLRVTPWACADVLRWVHKTYYPRKIIITENGVASNEILEDDSRIYFHQGYLTQISSAMAEGVNVVGYTIWSLMNNFEWIAGYTQAFGIIYVDFNDPNRTRIPKKSAKWFQNFCKTRCPVEHCEPEVF